MFFFVLIDFYDISKNFESFVYSIRMTEINKIYHKSHKIDRENKKRKRL